MSQDKMNKPQNDRPKDKNIPGQQQDKNWDKNQNSDQSKNTDRR